MALIREILAGALFVTTVILFRELFPSDSCYSVAWIPLVMAGASLAAGVIGGMGDAAAADAQAEAQNRQNINNWIRGENQKALRNGRELFNASHRMGQQAVKNKEIYEAAHLFQEESLDSLKTQERFLQNQLSRNYETNKGVIASSQASRNIQGGTNKLIKLVYAQQGLRDALQTESNFATKKKNVMRQTKNMLSQKTSNFFQANIQGATPMPEMAGGSTGWEIAGGVASGIAGGLGSFAGGMSAGLGGEAGTWSEGF